MKERKFICGIGVSLLASFRNSLVGSSSDKCQIVARDDVSPEATANSSQR